ncbi:MAG: L-histidine N(alpha)-methyltransferase [Microcoleaceae cyanobacterium]
MPTSNLSTFPTPPQSTFTQRLQIEHLINSPSLSEIEAAKGEDILRGLLQIPKSLPSKYLYDDYGSELFEQICQQPEYYPTRTEAAILSEYAGQIASLTGPCELVELGSGSSTKTRILLDAYQQLGNPLRYVPIDISGGILELSARELLVDYPSLQIHGLVGTYEAALDSLEPTALPRIICFLGSTLGNLNPEEANQFIQRVAAAMQPGEYFLIGTDLHKQTEVVEAAYNDAQGITAAFTLNILQHLNHRFDADFDLSQFEHIARYNPSKFQIETDLRSRQDQMVHLKDLGLTVRFAADERMRVEISRKFQIHRMPELLQVYNLEVLKTWTDKNQWYGLTLCQLRAGTEI